MIQGNLLPVNWMALRGIQSEESGTDVQVQAEEDGKRHSETDKKM